MFTGWIFLFFLDTTWNETWQQWSHQKQWWILFLLSSILCYVFRFFVGVDVFSFYTSSPLSSSMHFCLKRIFLFFFLTLAFLMFCAKRSRHSNKKKLWNVAPDKGLLKQVENTLNLPGLACFWAPIWKFIPFKLFQHIFFSLNFLLIHFFESFFLLSTFFGWTLNPIFSLTGISLSYSTNFV